METKFLGKKILFVTAHPDDESYAAAGTIFKNHQFGGKSFLICATLGEKGGSHLKKPVAKTKLKQIRKKELKSAAKFLKISKLIILNLPDCKLNNPLKKQILEKKILSLVKKWSPDIIAGFGTDGISGHLDHITAGRISKKIAKKLNLPFLAFCRPPQLQKSINQILKRRRKHGNYSKKIVYQIPNLSVKINPKIKLRAIKLHHSQLDHGVPFSNFPSRAAKEILSKEYFSVID